eukprot:IDg13545t1
MLVKNSQEIPPPALRVKRGESSAAQNEGFSLTRINRVKNPPPLEERGEDSEPRLGSTFMLTSESRSSEIKGDAA